MPVLCSDVSEGMCLVCSWAVPATEMENRVVEQLVSERAVGIGTWEVCWSRRSRKYCWTLFGQCIEEAGQSLCRHLLLSCHNADGAGHIHPHHLLICGIEITPSC